MPSWSPHCMIYLWWEMEKKQLWLITPVGERVKIVKLISSSHSLIFFFLFLFSFPFFFFCSDGKVQEVVVHIIQETRKKPFLGGFRHRLTAIEFHNASVQTLPKIRLPSPVEKFNRDTQTYKMRNRLQQTTNTTSTQMVSRKGYES